MSYEKKPPDQLGFIAAILGAARDTIEFWGPAASAAITRFFKALWYITIGAAVLVFPLILIFSWRLRLSLGAWLLGLAHSLLPPRKDFECRDKVTEYTCGEQKKPPADLPVRPAAANGGCFSLLEKGKEFESRRGRWQTSQRPFLTPT